MSRLQIVDKFVSGALQRASDSYSDSFNYSNKVDFLSHFSFQLFAESKTSFSVQDWMSFAQAYKLETLSGFNEREILSDLVTGRIVKREGVEYSFRYKMFYSYFVGRFIALRPDVLQSMISQNKHCSTDGLVEVLCGFAPDATPIINDLSSKLQAAIDGFYDDYSIEKLCLHSSA